MKKLFPIFLAVVFVSACGGGGSQGSVNPNFADVSEAAVPTFTEIDRDDADQVVTVEPGADGGDGGKIGTVADQDPSHTLCVLIDPAAGQDADLEVCESDRVNTETTSINGICPEADAVTRCARSASGSGPDFCNVTGATDYVFVIVNRTNQSVKIAYQVIDVSGYADPSCDSLEITENTILADDL